jgi:hypothetical protein
MRRLVAAGVGLVATLGTIGVAAPSAQAAETAAKPFTPLIYGNSSYKGTVTFSNRSVTAVGTVATSSGSGCRFGAITPYVGNTAYKAVRTPIVCDGVSGTGPISASADVVGGPTSVVVGLYAYDPATGKVTPLKTTSKIPR